MFLFQTSSKIEVPERVEQLLERTKKEKGKQYFVVDCFKKPDSKLFGQQTETKPVKYGSFTQNDIPREQRRRAFHFG
jgi:hypothetical protein